MGIRGLTTYISNHEDWFLEKIQLRDSFLVIDGCSLAAQLYQRLHDSNDSFGGDYDHYKCIITGFFEVLRAAVIIPLIIVDGGYQFIKYRTQKTRMENRISTIQDLNPATQGRYNMNPPLLMDTFKDVINELGIKMILCDYEADYHIASLARAMKCPVLSYDSDFFIYDCLYIPINTVTMECRKKQGKYVLECKLYRVERFLQKFGGMDKSLLPLVGTLLGNDYVNKNVFSNFFNQMKLPKKSSTKINDQQRTISALLHWLQPHTLESATARILSRLKYQDRERVAKIIEDSIEGFRCKPDYIVDYFGLLGNQKVNIVPMETDDRFANMYCLIDSTDRAKRKYYVPNWFIEKYRTGRLPSAFINLITKQTHLFQPQMGSIQLESNHSYTIPIIQVLFGLLTSPKKYHSFSVLGRSFTQITHSKEVPIYSIDGIDFPPLEKLPELPQNTKSRIFYSALGIPPDHVQLIQDNIPKEWELIILSIVYWCNKANAAGDLNVSIIHIQSLIMCVIYLKVVEPSLDAPPKEFVPDECNQVVNEAIDLDINSLIEALTFDDVISFSDIFATIFHLDSKLVSNPKNYRAIEVHQFGTFQSIFRHIRYLCQLLDEPCYVPSASEFYNGTFIYNLCVNLKRRKDSTAYLKDFMVHCPRFFDIFNSCMHILSLLGPESFYKRPTKC